MQSNDSEIIAVANVQRVQNLLEQRQHAVNGKRPKVVQVEEVSKVSEMNQPSDAANSQTQPLPRALHMETTFSSPQQSLNLSATPKSSFSSQCMPGSMPITPTSSFQFSSPMMASTHSHSSVGGPSKSPASSSPSLSSHSSMSSSTQFLNSNQVHVLSSPDTPQRKPQQEFSISQSLSHCADYDVSDLDMSTDCSFSNTNLHQLQSVRGHIPRDDNWQGMSSLPAISNPCLNCQPLLQSLSSRLSILEAKVEKLKRKQRKVSAFLMVEVIHTFFYY